MNVQFVYSILPTSFNFDCKCTMHVRAPRGRQRLCMIRINMFKQKMQCTRQVKTFRNQIQLYRCRGFQFPCSVSSRIRTGWCA